MSCQCELDKESALPESAPRLWVADFRLNALDALVLDGVESSVIMAEIVVDLEN